MIANIDLLIGRSFVSISGNICTVSKIGEGGLRTNWSKKQSQEDEIEAENWIVSLLEAEYGGKIVKTVCSNPKHEATMYKQWKENA